MNQPAIKITERDREINHFLTRSGWVGVAREKLPGDASFRRYERIRHAGRTAMLMDAPPAKEDTMPYIAVAEYLGRLGYSVPRIIAKDPRSGLLLLEDLGDDSFTLLLGRGGDEKELYFAACDVLADWQARTRQPAAPFPSYDTERLMKEVALFSDWFLPHAVGVEQALTWRKEYMQIWQQLLTQTPWGTAQFVHRDFHADNLFWMAGRTGIDRVGILDFQDAVLGDSAYDMVSLLEDARRDVAMPTVKAVLARYLAATGEDPESFMRRYALLGAQRNCKIIGIFTRLAARDKKPRYLGLLERVWGHLARDLTHPALAPLAQWMGRIEPQWRGAIALRDGVTSIEDVAR